MRVLLSLLCLLTLTLPAAAQAWRPPPDRLVYVMASRTTSADGRAVAESQGQQVVRVEDGLITLMAAGEGTLTRVATTLDRGLIPRRVEIRSGDQIQSVRYLYARDTLHGLWPLETGKRVVLDVVEDLGLGMIRIDYRLTIETGETDQVEIEGRSFEARRLIITREQEGQIVAEAEQWYAPALSTVLKSEVIFRPPNGPETQSTTQVSRIGLRPE